MFNKKIKCLKQQTKVAENNELEQNITPLFQHEGSDSLVSFEDYPAEPLFDEGCQLINMMKCNNAGYSVWLKKETRSFCYPSQENWYSFSWSLENMGMIRRAFPMSEDETLEGFRLADDYDSYMHQQMLL